MQRLLALFLSLTLITAQVPAPAFAQRAAAGRPVAVEAVFAPGAMAGAATFDAPGFLDFAASLPEFSGLDGLHAGAVEMALQAAPLLSQGDVRVRRTADAILITPAGAASGAGLRIALPSREAAAFAEVPDHVRAFMGRLRGGMDKREVSDLLTFTASLYDGSRLRDAVAAPAFSAPALGEIGRRSARSLAASRDVPAPSQGSETKRADRWRAAAGAGHLALGLAGTALSGAVLQMFAGIDGALLGVPALSAALYGVFHMSGVREALHRENVKAALRAGARALHEGDRPGARERIEAQAKGRGLRAPLILVAPEGFPALARAMTTAGTDKAVLLVSKAALRSDDFDSIIAHEIQHVVDARSHGLVTTMVKISGLAMIGAAVNFGLGALGLPALGPEPGFLVGAASFLGMLAALVANKVLHVALIEFRADMAAVAATGSADGILRVLRGARSTAGRRAVLNKALGRASRESSLRQVVTSLLGQRESDLPAADAQDPTKPEYYTRPAPDWAERLDVDADEAFASAEDYAAYRAEVAKLRPVARWMAHLYKTLRDDQVQKHPNILTLQDILNWALFVKKFESMPGWTLSEAVAEGAEKFFKLPLPKGPVDERDLRAEFTAAYEAVAPALEGLEVPEHFAALAAKKLEAEDDDAAKGNAEPALFDADRLEAMPGGDFIRVDTVQDRVDDLISLYSTDHKQKFFPLLIGPTAEGKSSIVKAIFSDPQFIAALGRQVPVVSQPVKEQMTKRELFGAPSSKGGVELGFLAQAAKHGWVLVLEELNEASGEFLKSLNGALHQIRKKGFFEFEMGGETIRIKAHPHFWVVGTENPSEGNYAFTREQHSPDFVKRFVVREYSPIEPSEQAEIMYGLALEWYGEDFVKRNGIDLALLETIMTQVHEPVRKSAKAGQLGGDNLEEYEFNRRTLHRFLKRWMFDLAEAEKRGKVDVKLNRKLLARELMETYATEVRDRGEVEAIWDKMNIALDLEADHGIKRGDVELDVRAFYLKDGVLYVDEALVPVYKAQRDQGGERIPGPEYRLTVVPSLAKTLYRAIRNRQFGEHQFSSGPTGTAKTSGQFFIAHLLKENLFTITVDEQTANREFHGGFVRNAETGEFEFKAGIVARAMMYDPKGVLQDGAMGPNDVRKSMDVGATLLVDEANASTIVESMNPALDDGVLHLSDGRHTAVAGAGFHVVLAMNPVGEGYVGYPLSDALRSRGQTVYHYGDLSEDELSEIILDELTGVRRHILRPAK